jgi:DNA-binding NarL/FixJ family response regulator
VLELLAGQMAISLENAWLYGKLKKESAELEMHNRALERTVKEQTQELRAMAKELFTGRERQVLELLVQGRTNKEIGRELAISPVTVKHHLQNLLNKTGTGSRTALAVKALECLVPK